MPASEHTPSEHDRLREAIDEIKDDAKETRSAVSRLGDTMRDLREAVLGWKGEVELRFADVVARLKVLEEWQRDKNAEHKSLTSSKVERANAVMNAVLIAVALWLVYKVTGIKAP